MVFRQSNPKTIDYDKIGNPVNYCGAQIDWFGRQMTSYSKGNVSATFTYDADGLRGSKTVNDTKTTYFYVGDKLMYECRPDGIELYFYYDSYDNLSVIQYVKVNDDGDDDSYFFYVTTNMQGDVLGIYSANGDLKASYEYDAWGNCTITSDTSGIDLGNINPIRYRGYYYDNETGLYYLQSRYYNPEIGRFLNSDNITDSNAGVLGYNTYIYCANNPVNNSDPTGHWIIKDAIKWVAKKVSSAVSKIREKTSSLRGTYQRGITGSAACVVEGNISFGVAADLQGNVGVTFSYGAGAGSLNASAGIYETITNAPTIDKLDGPSFQIGGSGNVYVFSAGLEYTGMQDSRTGETYHGCTKNGGVGLSIPAPGEIHTDIAYTSVFSINVFDEIEDTCMKIMEW